jgi:hypothetical protein
MNIVIAGDIIGSKKNLPDHYLDVVQSILKEHARDSHYQIYRGDSFQAQINKPVDALKICLIIKSALKKTASLDVRIAIGLGDVELIDNNIAVSTGSALIRSGELLDSLKDIEQNLMVNGENLLDDYLNTALKLGLLYMDNWTENSAEITYELLTNPNTNQENLGKKLGIQQATVSRRKQRANWNETAQLINLFAQYYKHLCHDATDNN